MYSNHFIISLDKSLELDEYNVTGFPTRIRQVRQRELTERFVREIPDLAAHLDKFAVDNSSTIVTWDYQALGLSRGESSSVPSCTVDGLSLKLTHSATHTSAEIYDHVNGKATVEDAARNLEPVKKAVSTVILHGLRSQLGSPLESFRVGLGNSFFLINTVKNLGQNAVFQHRRGYTASIVPGQNHIFMNVDTASKAFYPPITVYEFIEAFRKDVGQSNVLLRHYLATVHVKINILRKPDDYDGTPLETLEVNQPHRREKTICSVGRASAIESFGYHDNVITVADFFASSMIIQIVDVR